MIEGIVIGSNTTGSPNTFASPVLAPTPIKLSTKGNNLVASISNATMLTPLSAITSSATPAPPTSSASSTSHTVTIDWTHDRIIKLIQLYEKKSVLWNPSNPEYFHRDIRNMVYDDLVRELNITNLTVNETKRKLENLRSYFRRETKKLQDHERKTGEKLHSKWPYYESLQFIHEFMSVKNEGGSENGVVKVKHMVRSSYLPTMNVKSEPHVSMGTSEECAMQVPVGSATIPDSSFNLGSQDLVAVLKALQGPLAEQAALCFANSLGGAELQQQLVEPTKSPPICGGPHTPHSASPLITEVEGSCPTPSSNCHITPCEKVDEELCSATSVVANKSKKRKLHYGSTNQIIVSEQPENNDVIDLMTTVTRDVTPTNGHARDSTSTRDMCDDLCADYGRTVAHQLRQMDDYKRDMLRLQIDQLLFDAIHRSVDTKTETLEKETSTVVE